MFEHRPYIDEKASRLIGGSNFFSTRITSPKVDGQLIDID
jgi:hypothetical protein